MRTRSIALLALLTLTLTVFAVACGGKKGGGAPVIDSFTASPSTLPVGGGNVTLTWSVRNASSIEIEPGVGMVTEPRRRPRWRPRRRSRSPRRTATAPR